MQVIKLHSVLVTLLEFPHVHNSEYEEIWFCFYIFIKSLTFPILLCEFPSSSLTAVPLFSEFLPSDIHHIPNAFRCYRITITNLLFSEESVEQRDMIR